VRSVYGVLLLLYPRIFRDAFGAEMKTVFAERAAEHRQQGLLRLMRFIVAEAAGLLIGSVRERAAPPRLAAVVGGIIAAAVLHSVLYAGTFKFLHAITTAVGEASVSHDSNDAVIIGLCGVTAFLALLPVFFLVSMRLVQRGRS
jgi:hypothetical protein